MENPTYQTQKQYLLDVPLPLETSSYKPISHKQLIDLTLESIYQSGFKVDKEIYSSARDGKIANGRYTISDVADSEMQLQIGWQNSYDKSKTLKFAIGTHIFICGNGCVSGNFGHFKRKHMGEIQIFTPATITEYIKSAGDAFEEIQRQRELMKQIQVTKRQSAELIGRMIIEEEFIESSQLNIIRQEMKKPTYDYGAQGSLWELYNFGTFALRDVHPGRWMEDHVAIHKFFMETALITPVVQAAPVQEEDKRQLSLFDDIWESSEPIPEPTTETIPDTEEIVYNSDDEEEETTDEQHE